jgi:O-succinylbenzoic acid--CoA ligase
VYAPHLSGETLPTHDLAVTAPGGRFRITGRSDNIINTGGIKVSPEGIEDLLQERIPWPFFVTGLPDPSLGEKITLIVRKERLDEEDLTTVRRAVQKIRPPTHRPRKMIAVPGFIYTGNEKLQRSQSRELAMKEGTVYDL